MTTLEMAIDPFAKKEYGKRAQESVPLSVDDKSLSYNLNLYSDFIANRMPINVFSENDLLNARSKVSKLELMVLNKIQIAAFFSKALQNRNELEHSYDENNTYLCLFLTRMIKDSYATGHNGFEISAPEEKLYYLGDHLKGTKDSPLEITVSAQLLVDSFEHAEHIKASVHAPAMTPGDKSSHSIFMLYQDAAKVGNKVDHCSYEIQGNVTFSLGERSVDSKFKVHGSTSHIPSESIRSKFMIYGNVLDHTPLKLRECEFWLYGSVSEFGLVNPVKTIFYVAQKKAYKMIKKKIGFWPRILGTNSVYRIKDTSSS